MVQQIEDVLKNAGGVVLTDDQKARLAKSQAEIAKYENMLALARAKENEAHTRRVRLEGVLVYLRAIAPTPEKLFKEEEGNVEKVTLTEPKK